jgi:hypothetical protein
LNVAFILTIRERNDSWAGRPPIVSEYATRAEAEAELRDYVEHNWDTEMDTERPDDPEDMVQEYFEQVLEAYEILETA